MMSIQTRNGEVDFWVGDLVSCGDDIYALSKFYTLDHSKVMAEVYRVYYYPEYNIFKYVITARLLHAPVRLITNKPLDFAAIFQGEPQSEATFTRLRTLSPYKRVNPSGKRDYLRVPPINMFTGDMSGNTTKKFNKFDNFSFIPAALSYKKRNALDNTFFIFASNKLSAPRMLKPIVDDLLLLENGVEMLTPTGEAVVIPVQFITADNARHAELASALGSRARRGCRACLWDSNTVYKLVGGKELLRLGSFDVLEDLPTELLHTVMLGVGKSLVTSLLVRCLNENESVDPLGFYLNINDMCSKDHYGDVHLQQSDTLYTCHLNQLQLNASLDLSINKEGFNAVTPCKFGSTCWLLTHKVPLL